MPPKIKAALFSIQHAAIGIISFVEDKSFDDFDTDLMLRSAAERQFEIIGEAMTRLRKEAPETLDRITDARNIISFRNVLIHGYDSVRNEITWRIIKDKLPLLASEVESLLADHP